MLKEAEGWTETDTYKRTLYNSLVLKGKERSPIEALRQFKKYEVSAASYAETHRNQMMRNGTHMSVDDSKSLQSDRKFQSIICVAAAGSVTSTNVLSNFNFCRGT